MDASPQSQSPLELKRHSVSETGHAKNVANFQNLISLCEGFAATYNPSNDRLKIVQLKTAHEAAVEKINNVRIHKTNFDNHTNLRRSAFEDLKPLATRIINAFIVSGADKMTVEDAKAINKKIQGVPSSKSVNTQMGDSTQTKTISASQQSYDKKIDHLANLIELLSQSRIYNPNEQELKIVSLQAKLSDLQTKNRNLSESYALYSNALIQRNKELYNSLTGLVQTAKQVKLYIKSIYGASSGQYRLVRRLQFKIRTEDQ